MAVNLSLLRSRLVRGHSHHGVWHISVGLGGLCLCGQNLDPYCLKWADHENDYQDRRSCKRCERIARKIAAALQ